MFEDKFCNYGILPSWCRNEPNKIRNCIFSENLRPNKLFINPGPLVYSLFNKNLLFNSLFFYYSLKNEVFIFLNLIIP